MPPGLSEAALAALVRDAQIEMTFARSRSSNLVSSPFGVLVCWVLWGAIDHRLLLGWLAAKVAVSLTRIVLTRGFDRDDPSRRSRWGTPFHWAIGAEGAVFGLLGTLLLPANDPVLAATMVSTLLGVAAIGLVVLSMSFVASLAITVPAVLPAMLVQLTRGSDIGLYTGMGMGVFLGLAIVEGRRASEHTRAMLRLRFQMDELAAQRQQALDLAERSSAVKSQFLATMSHEMRTPLHGLLGMARLLRREAPGFAPPVQAERIGIVERSGEHLLAIINDVLDHARIESGHLQLVERDFDLVALLGSVSGLMTAAAQEKALVLRVEHRLGESCPVRGDPDRLRQVLLNLAGNAIKFTPRGRVEIVAWSDHDARFVIEVRDTGPGIPPPDRERIFKPFQQLDGSFARRHGGTGLGLTISRELVQAMGGRLECLDAGGGGACFRLLLPLAPANAVLPEQNASAPMPLPLAGRILLVEDNAVNAIVAEASLRRLGLEVERVDNGETAVDRAATTRFDLILMDCQMPGIDGFEATARIRHFERTTQRRQVPIVALTANALAGDRERSLRSGMDDHLAKPFRDEDLSRVLQRRLAV